MAEKQFLNGVFADKKTGQYGEYFDLHIPNLGRFLESIQSFKLNSKGGLRFRMTEKQAQNGEMSIYWNDWEPTGQPQIPQRSAPPSAPRQPQKPAPGSVASTSYDDLPF